MKLAVGQTVKLVLENSVIEEGKIKTIEDGWIELSSLNPKFTDTMCIRMDFIVGYKICQERNERGETREEWRERRANAINELERSAKEKEMAERDERLSHKFEIHKVEAIAEIKRQEDLTAFKGMDNTEYRPRERILKIASEHKTKIDRERERTRSHLKNTQLKDAHDNYQMPSFKKRSRKED